MKHLTAPVKRLMIQSGAAFATAGALLQIGSSIIVAHSQPEAVQQALAGNLQGRISGILYLVTIAVAALIALIQGAKAISNGLAAVGGLLAAFVGTAGAVLYRDAIRDTTLLQKGFDVWSRTEVSNWSVIGAFLLLFVIMLGIIVWLLLVMKQAAPPVEQAAS